MSMPEYYTPFYYGSIKDECINCFVYDKAFLQISANLNKIYHEGTYRSSYCVGQNFPTGQAEKSTERSNTADG